MQSAGSQFGGCHGHGSPRALSLGIGLSLFWSLGLRVYSLGILGFVLEGLGVWGLGLRVGVWGLGFRVWDCKKDSWGSVLRMEKGALLTGIGFWCIP